MGLYDLAVYFWSTVVVAAVGVPFVWAAAREAVRAIEHLDEHSSPSHPSLISVPSSPRPSAP